MGRRQVTVAVRILPEDAATVRAEAQRSGRTLGALLLAGATPPTGALPPELLAMPALVELLARELAELRAAVAPRAGVVAMLREAEREARAAEREG